MFKYSVRRFHRDFTMIRTDDPRLGQLLINRGDLDLKMHHNKLLIGLIQVPCDEGVVRNGGRPGASVGPEIVMGLLPRFGCLTNREWNIDLQKSNIGLVDYGRTDSEHLENVHMQLEQLVKCCLESNIFPVCIGGGNDQSWANGSAWIQYLRTVEKSPIKLTVINVDAHLDVRPLVKNSKGDLVSHSGSPFRQLLELASKHDDMKLIEFAAQGHQCSSDHVNYVLTQGGDVRWLSEIQESYPSCYTPKIRSSAAAKLKVILDTCSENSRHVFFSFDIDSIQASDCPGVSCPSSIGLTAVEALELCFVAGRSTAVELMDLSEFNPKIESSQTGRLVTNMIYHFILGYSQRH